MRLLVRMYVNRGNGFILYFLGSEKLNPPNPDIDALENREWMYQQNETFIEIQHYWGSEYDEGFQLESEVPLGFKAMVFKCHDLDEVKDNLSNHGFSFNSPHTNKIEFKSPDSHMILIEQN